VDENTPRYLRIAGDKLSCNDFVKLLTELTTKKLHNLDQGALVFKFSYQGDRFFSPSEKNFTPLGKECNI
jgi:hypothetical protein